VVAHGAHGGHRRRVRPRDRARLGNARRRRLCHRRRGAQPRRAAPLRDRARAMRGGPRRQRRHGSVRPRGDA